MPSAYEEREKDKSAGSQREIASVMSALAGRQAENNGARKLTGPERAAVLMLALGEQHGSKVWSLLDDDELRELSVVMSTSAPSRRRRSKACSWNSSRACRPRAR